VIHDEIVPSITLTDDASWRAGQTKFDFYYLVQKPLSSIVFLDTCRRILLFPGCHHRPCVAQQHPSLDLLLFTKKTKSKKNWRVQERERNQIESNPHHEILSHCLPDGTGHRQRLSLCPTRRTGDDESIFGNRSVSRQ